MCILQVQDIVDDYKNANLTISKNCKKISEMLLVKIDGKRVYDNLEFEEEQVNHEKILDMIRRLLSSLSLWVFQPVRWGSKSIGQSIVSWSILPLVVRLLVHQSFSQSVHQSVGPTFRWLEDFQFISPSDCPTCSSVSRSNASDENIKHSNNRLVKITRLSNRYGAFCDQVNAGDQKQRKSLNRLVLDTTTDLSSIPFQKKHRSIVQTRLQVTHVEIVSIMKQTYEVFKHDGQEVLWIVVLDVKCKDFYHWKKLKGLS